MLLGMPRSSKPVPQIPRPQKKALPFPFILDALAPLEPVVRPMFSGHAVYIGDKIVCMLRERAQFPQDNGMWMVFAEPFEEENGLQAMRTEFPSLRPIHVLHGKIKHWLILPVDSPHFESEAMHACDLLLAHDRRLGRIPKSRQARAERRASPTEARHKTRSANN